MQNKQKETYLSRNYCYQIVEDPNNAEFPLHPDKVSRYPNWTDRKLGGMPVFPLYCAVFGFCAVYIIGGLLGALAGLPMTHMHYASVIGLLLGYVLGRFVLEPKLMLVAFEDASHEQQLRAVESMRDALEQEAEIRAYRQEKAEAEAQNYDRSVYEDDEELEEPSEAEDSEK
ncbi:MAG: hypothetical protein ACI4PM_02290 [Butyricicoccus sp.]